MLRNVESHFSQLPQADVQRSTMDMSHGHTTTFNAGRLIPIMRMSILPGDTVDLKTSVVARLQTLLTPIMGNVSVDIFAFFTPYRLVWPHWPAFLGENINGPWAQQTSYSVPQISSPSGGWNVGTIADYLGIPPKVDFNASNGLMPTALAIRSYALICQEWFRDQNLTDPLNIPTGDSNQTGSNGSNYITDVANGGQPFKVAKYHDYFTSCLPDPQKNRNPVTFPLISGTMAPVKTGDVHDKYSTSLKLRTTTNMTNGNAYPLELYHPSAYTDHKLGEMQYKDVMDSGASGHIQDVYPVNLWADLSTSVGAVTVNQLRLAFQMQKFYERQTQGTRYRELIKSMFGITTSDARMMIPEYLGGHRFPISIHQVTNTSQSSSADLGDLGAMSNTSDVHDTFFKSFEEFGELLVLACVRYDHVYAQGLNRDFTRTSYWDYFWPLLANIGEQPVYKYEIDATVRSGENRLAVFGYNEAWASYRYIPNRVSGLMRPQVSGSLASWNLADNYAAMPSLSDSWIREDIAPIDRTLAVTSSVSDQILADFWFDLKVTRPMPVFSVPGLIDHH